jgi:MurE/MurF fusion protein
MKLSQIIEPENALAAGLSPESLEREISGLTADSREVKPGYLFAALPGTTVDGTKFIPNAIAAGAAAVLVATDADLSQFQDQVIVVRSDNPRRDLASMAARFCAVQPETAVAVTGTSGKTSVVEFTRQIFAASGAQAASVGTIGIVKPDGGRYGSLTTPDPVTLHRSLAELAEDGVTHLAFEASSHGLDQHRLDGVQLTAAAFTNLGRDHLDYHPDLASYLNAKLRLFTELLTPGQIAVINADGAAHEDVAAAAKARGLKLLTVGRAGHDLRLLSVERDGFSQRLRIEAGSNILEVRLPLIGDYQVENALVAAGLAIAAGVPAATAVGAFAELKGVPGRLEIIGESQGGLVVVDYAHKPEALTAALQGVRPFVTGKLICVFGCGGDRDRGKREIMGRIAEEQADVVIVTDDNPRGEQPSSIRAEVLKGCPNAIEIGDRREAIVSAVGMAGEGDVVLIAGKGHETGQIVGDKVLPFSDHDVAREAIALADDSGPSLIQPASGTPSPLWNWDELIIASGGEPDGQPGGSILGISIDSRAIAKGDLFVALKDKRDGHEFVEGAFASGAAAALVSRDYARRPGDGALLRVDDTLHALERIGIAARQRLSPEARVIAVTGSVGKTTTKEMLRACLERLGPTHASDKSFNNHWGVPLTLARMPRDSHFGVFEIGMNHSGEITPLTKMVRPDVAIITTVAPVHLEHFASVEEIAAAKAEILAGLVPGGVAVLNRDNEHFGFLRSCAEAHGATICDFSGEINPQAEHARVRLSSARETRGQTIVSAAIDGFPAEIHYALGIPGRHIVMNSLAVIGTLDAVGADFSAALPALTQLKPPHGRGVRVELSCQDGKALLIDESYNANPVSMRAAIAVLAGVPRDEFPRRIAVIGDMLELGPQAKELHAELAAPLAEACVDLVFAAGPLTEALFEAIPQNMRGSWGKTPPDIESELLATIRPGDAVMVKGSNGAKTWQLAQAIARHFSVE